MCEYILFDMCFPGFAPVLAVFVLLVVLGATGLFVSALSRSGEVRSEVPHYPETSQEHLAREDAYDHPYTVSRRILAGRSERGHGAFFVIKRYDEEDSLAVCQVIVEVPAGATDVSISHDYDDEDAPFGTVSISYRIGLTAYLDKIRLAEETLEDSSYYVSIVGFESSHVDLS